MDESFVHIDEQEMQSDGENEYDSSTFDSTSLQLKSEKSIEDDDDDQKQGQVQVENRPTEPEPISPPPISHQYESLGIEGVDDIEDSKSSSSIGIPSFIGSKLMNFKTRFSSVSSAGKLLLFMYYETCMYTQ